MLLRRLNHALLVLVTASRTRNVLAAPHPHLHPRQSSDGNGGQDNNPTSIQKQIWIPLVVVAALFVVGTIFACCGRRFRRTALFSLSGGVAQAAGIATGTAVPGVRELTADQLVNNGTGNNATTGATGGTNRARRPRRTRRTPSQISTHSLPAYMKEPGDEEIVIVRGADELHDDIPITVEMPPVDENANESPRGSFEASAPSSAYAPIPPTPHDMPLLHNHDHEQQHLSPDRPGLGTRPSFDSGVSSGEDGPGNYPDAAPAYETVVLDDPPPAAAPPAPQRGATSPTAERASSDQQAGTGSVRRRSVFASIFNPRNSRLGLPTTTSSPPIPLVPQPSSPEPRSSTGHSHEDPRPSVSSERDPRRSRILRHQPSHSGSGSMFSLLSRTRSNGNLSISGAEALTSPSMISLHSISNPLTHTLVKTEFTYPKNGPTPDQVRLISSRESFARFGRPYGADAIAFAASSSRINLEPPPGFEEVAGGSCTGAEDQEGRGTPSSGSQDEEGDANEANTSSPSAPPDTQEAAPTIVTHVLSDVAEVESPVVVDQPNDEIAPTLSLPAHTSATDAQPTPGPVSPTLPAAENIPRAASSSPEPAAPVLSPPVASLSSKLVAPPSPSNASPPATASSKAPPSAFKGTLATTPVDNSFPARAASRASSFLSFATAEESLHTPGPYESQVDLNDDAYESAVETPVNLTAPSTPRMEARHLHEETDTTITPGR